MWMEPRISDYSAGKKEIRAASESVACLDSKMLDVTCLTLRWVATTADDDDSEEENVT